MLSFLFHLRQASFVSYWIQNKAIVWQFVMWTRGMSFELNQPITNRMEQHFISNINREKERERETGNKGTKAVHRLTGSWRTIWSRLDLQRSIDASFENSTKLLSVLLPSHVNHRRLFYCSRIYFDAYIDEKGYSNYWFNASHAYNCSVCFQNIPLIKKSNSKQLCTVQ